MTRTVIGLFRDSNEAQAALQDLESAGFTREHVNLVAFDGSGAYSNLSEPENELGSNTAKGATAGGLAGFLIGLAAVAIPGIGPVVAAGPIAAALAGAGVGAATGGMLGALSDMGVPGSEAKYYQEAIRRGGTMLVVQVGGDTSSEQAQSILDRHGAIDIEQQSAEWRAEGWSPEDAHTDALNYGDEGGASRRGSRVYPDRRNSG